MPDTHPHLRGLLSQNIPSSLFIVSSLITHAMYQLQPSALDIFCNVLKEWAQKNAVERVFNSAVFPLKSQAPAISIRFCYVLNSIPTIGRYRSATPEWLPTRNNYFFAQQLKTIKMAQTIGLAVPESDNSKLAFESSHLLVRQLRTAVVRGIQCRQLASLNCREEAALYVMWRPCQGLGHRTESFNLTKKV